MKRLLAVLLAALLPLSLLACGPETPEEPAPPEEELVRPAPEAPEEAPEPPGEAPEETPEEPSEDETPAGPAGSAAAVTAREESLLVEELISVELRTPAVDSGRPETDQVLNDYYANVDAKLQDLCWGELYELALESRSTFTLQSDFTVAYNQDDTLSIFRSVSVTSDDTGVTRVNDYAETFDLASGGLLLAGDLFSVPEADWTARLTECVARQIREDPYHDLNYFEQWEDLVTRAFDRDQFYLTGDAFVVFYQENDLGGAAETVFPIPWSQLDDIRKLP